jgi:ABC-type branched-subunit amino acid transport system ATPase component
MKKTPFLEVDRITKQFGGLFANDRIDFTVEKGEIVSIIGPNGTGKSTLIKTVAGLLHPKSGEIYFNKEPIHSEIFKIIVEISQNGVTVLLVEQNVFEALQISNRAYVLQTGQIVLEGRGEDLLKSDLVRKAYLGM